MTAVETEAKAAAIAAKHRSVSQALADVITELPGIGKDGRADPKQGGYAYRGIEQITTQVQPLFAKHGIVFAPRVESWEVRDIEVNGKPWTDTFLLVAYDVYGPAGDHITVGPILAIGRDNSDKGANKCMTQAFKYALLQTLCVSDAKDDADGSNHEADARRPPPRLPMHPVKVQSLRDKCAELGEPVGPIVKAASQGRTENPEELFADEADAVKDALAEVTPA